MHQHFGSNSRTFYYTSIWSQVSFQDSQTAGFRIRFVDCADDFRIYIHCILNIFMKGFAGDSHDISVNQSGFFKLLQHGIDAACCIEVFHIGWSSRSEMTEVWRPL